MNGVPTVLRLWLMGTAWGVARAIVSAFVYLAGMFVVFGSYDGNVGDLLLSIGLAAMLCLVEPRAAVCGTVALVLVGQAVGAVAIFGLPESSSLWLYVLVPAITVVPLTLATRGAARDASAPTVSHRDTLAA